jgi:hypothetical protein
LRDFVPRLGILGPSAISIWNRPPELNIVVVSVRYTTENFFEVIGHISVFFSTWDVLTSLLIIRLVKRQNPLPDLNRKTLGQKLKLLGSLTSTDVVNPALLGRVQLALPEAALIAEKRNRFIHDQWLFAEERIPTGEITLLSVEVVMGGGGRAVNMVPTNFHITELYAFLESVGRQQGIFHALLESLPISN